LPTCQIWRIPHPLVAHMQTTPDEVRAGGAESIRSLSDRLWWKCKTSGLQAIVTTRALPSPALPRAPEGHGWAAKGTRSRSG
jgi:hypothetical protein